MLPGSTTPRSSRGNQKKGRSQEIQRLIGRSLRASFDLSLIGERTITVDCDVLQADGGTRTASVIGSVIALQNAIVKLQKSKALPNNIDFNPIAAISVGIVNNEVKETISVGRYNLQGGYTAHVDQFVYEVMFTDKYDGCYERPEYYLIELYQRGVSHNCFIVRLIDVKKELYYPDDPSDKGNTQIKKYIKNHNVKFPPIMLASVHSYFTRLTGNSWYVISYYIDPKELGGPNSCLLYTSDAADE